ncbi:Energy transducer TonB (fragment) [Erythrobacter sp. EC-HK427]
MASPLDTQSLATRIIGSYPSQAMRAGQEGTVGVQVTISTTGSVTRCVVTSSSGYPILDAAACDVMERHAVFAPARNRAGDPVEGLFSTSVTYALD